MKLLESVEDFQEHLDFGVHDYSIIRPTELAKVTDKWVQMHQIEKTTIHAPTVTEEQIDAVEGSVLPMGCAIKPERVARRHSAKLKSFLDELFDEGEKTKNKCTPKKVLNFMRKTLDIEDIIPNQSIKSYFSRRAFVKRTQNKK